MKKIISMLAFIMMLLTSFAFANEGAGVCPISGDKVNPKASYEYKGKTYQFCCMQCIDKFKKNPEKYIKG